MWHMETLYTHRIIRIHTKEENRQWNSAVFGKFIGVKYVFEIEMFIVFLRYNLQR